MGPGGERDEDAGQPVGGLVVAAPGQDAILDQVRGLVWPGARELTNAGRERGREVGGIHPLVQYVIGSFQ